MRSFSVSASILVIAASALGQYASQSAEPEAGSWWPVYVGILVVLGAAAIVAFRTLQKHLPAHVSEGKPGNKKSRGILYRWDPKEDERAEKEVAERDRRRRESREKQGSPNISEAALQGIDIEEVREKMEQIRFERLPINQIKELKRPRSFDALPMSELDEVLSAIENSDVEYVDDDEIREAALDILAEHKTRNSVEALSQAALYDLSANLRSKAVGALAAFNHESVFEAIVLACADPSREVRAAGAKALFSLGFSRADAWLRLARCEDEFRISQAAKAAVEAGFVPRSLDRLVHKDITYANEALSLLALLIKAGETDEMFQHLEKTKDARLGMAVIRVFQIVGDESVAPKVEEMLEKNAFPEEVAVKAKELLDTFEPVAA